MRVLKKIGRILIKVLGFLSFLLIGLFIFLWIADDKIVVRHPIDLMQAIIVASTALLAVAVLFLMRSGIFEKRILGFSNNLLIFSILLGLFAVLAAIGHFIGQVESLVIDPQIAVPKFASMLFMGQLFTFIIALSLSRFFAKKG